MFRQITIVGTGLIGGSFALAVRAAGYSGRIIGCDREAVLDQALQRGAIDAAMCDPLESIKGSDLVVLSCPVSCIIDMIERLGPLLPNGCILADTGSTKGEIVDRSRSVFGDGVAQRFIPSHPIAGKEQGGIENADATLFRDSPWIITPPTPSATPSQDFIRLIELAGARPIIMDAARHDRLLAWTSHLPQLLSTALAAAIADEFSRDAKIDDVSGRALADMTRIAGSPYSMWRDIALTNTKNIHDALLRLEQRIAHIRENLKTRALEEEFDTAHRLHDSRPKQ